MAPRVFRPPTSSLSRLFYRKRKLPPNTVFQESGRPSRPLSALSGRVQLGAFRGVLDLPALGFELGAQRIRSGEISRRSGRVSLIDQRLGLSVDFDARAIGKS